jgi:transcription-repair coupling factor (superfamily II helicase)
MHRILEYQKTIVICENQFFLNHVEHFLNEKGVSNYANLNDLETLPYDIFSPHPEKLANRLETMAEIANKEKLIVLTTINSLIQPYFDKASINNFSYKFSQNDKLDREKLLNSLASAGYSSSEVVTERSEFAVRGSVIDIYPSNSKLPIRINLDDDSIESIRLFDKDSQISISKIDQYQCRATKGFQLDEESIAVFKKNWRQIFSQDGEFFDQVSSGKFPEGIESYFPLFYERKPLYEDFFKNYSKFLYGNVSKGAEAYWNLINRRYEDFISDLDRPPLKPSFLYNDPQKILLNSEQILHPKDEKLNESFDSEENFIPQTKRSNSEVINNQYEFKIGNRLVHTNYGIGLYRGLKNLNNTECFVIEYEGQETLYVPVDAMNLLTPYVGNQDIKLDSLSRNNWKIKKEKSEQKAYDIAAELLEAEAKRKIDKSDVLKIDDIEYQNFAKGFGFQETIDQAKAILEVKEDLASSKPQDRLVCGEVGFGKTEIALRAAFICAKNLKQVCVLAPTTLLARQHYDLFKDRFQESEIKIDFLTRERTPKEKEKIIEELSNGEISIVIGTHALLNDAIKFEDLGLLVVDEEHKFGVRQKEKLRKIKKGVNVIYLSATPIPRSLNMALSKVRDISIISSAPPGRKAVETVISRYSESLIQEALQREFHRSGQSFYLINNVASLENKAKELKRLMPEASIAIGHGQMHPNDLKDIMFKFHHHEIDILICTTIIESGLDIPNANTLLIEDAQNFGLSQLHQIRGRVGRSKRQAYAYFLTSNEKQLTKNAAARIEALKYGDSLNSGFNLAMRDLEIRGAGEILGEKQSGAIDFVGLTLFTSMIERSIKMLKGSIDSEINDIEIKIGTNGYITEKYIPQPEVRLTLYKKISSIKKLEDLSEIKKELEDRFGSMPKETADLLTLTQIRILSSKLSINRISSNKEKISLFLDENNLLTPPNSKIEKIMINFPESVIDKVDFLLNKLKSFHEQLQKAS